MRDKVSLKTTCIKNVQLKIVKIRTGCQYKGYLNYCENLKWAAQNLRLGHMRPTGRGVDIAGLTTYLQWSCFDSMLCSHLGNANSDVDHINVHSGRMFPLLYTNP